MSTGTTPIQEVSTTQMIRCDLIDLPDVSQSERTFNKDWAEDLARSIEVQGMLQPVMVRPSRDKPGRYEMVFGRHRFYAKHDILKHPEIESKVIELDDDDFDMARISENLWRNSLDESQYLISIKRWQAYYDAKHPDAAGYNRSYNYIGRPKTRYKTDESGDLVVVKEKSTAPKPAKMPTLEEQVVGTTGKSKDQAKRDIRIAKAFTEDQLRVLAQKKVTQDDALTIVKAGDKDGRRGQIVSLVASGMEAKDAVRQVAGEEALPKKKASANGKPAAEAQPGDELSDAEWLDQECSAVRRMLKDTRHFDATALWYRKTRAVRQDFRKAMKPFLADLDLKKNPLARQISRVVNVKHPKDWIMCGSCKGVGATPIGAPCNECGVGGFKVEVDYVKSRAPKAESVEAPT